MILIALGANLPTNQFGSPIQTLTAAIIAVNEAGVKVVSQSRWYESAAVPPSDQPNYINGVIAVETVMQPSELLGLLHEIEHEFGRRRFVRNEARGLDLDLIDYDGMIVDDGHITLPHPRMQQRAFVLLPLAEIAPNWVHPTSAQPLRQLINSLPDDGPVFPIE